jgi:hypothetical protein
MAMAAAVAVSMGVGAVAGAVVFTPGVGAAATEDDGADVASAICAGAIGPVFGASPIDAAADAIGIGVSELLAEIRDGRTIAEVAEEHGVEPSAVVQAIVDERRAWLDEAVADGRLTREQADERLEAIEEAVTALVNADGPRVPLMGHPGAWGFADGPLAAAAEAIGIRPAALLAEIADGGTIAEVAEREGADVADVVDAVAAALRERLDSAVEAGWIDQDEADERAAELDAQAEAIVNGELPPFGFPHGGFGGRGHGFPPLPSWGGEWGAEASVH